MTEASAENSQGSYKQETPPIAPLPKNEAERLAALQRYKILDTPPEAAFDRITALAARLFGVPIVLISLVDESRAWFKSCYGFDCQEVRRDDTICSFALLYDDVLVVPDAQQDDRFVCNPFVQQEPGLRFYVGAPLLTPDGLNLGTLCLLDTQPRDAFTDEQKATLVDLAAMVVDELELRLAARKITQTDAALLEVTRGVSAVTGDAFFVALVQHLTKALSMDYACISLLVNKNPETLRTIAFCAQGKILDNVEYSLQDTPCLEVIQQRKLCCYPQGIQALFPKDYFLTAFGIESYVSIPFFDSTGNLLGLLSVMDSKPLENLQLAESLLTIFAMRIATELERQRVEEHRQETARHLQLYADVVHNTQVGIVVWQLENFNDPGSFRLLIANPSASETTGFDFEPLIGKTMAERFPKLLQTSLVQQYMQVVHTGQSIDLGEIPYSEDGITAGIYSLKAFPLPDQCLGLAFENITSRKHIEAQLQASQHYSQQVAETMPGILFVHDLIEQRNVYTNRQIADLLGYTSEQVQAMGTDAVPTLIHPDDLERIFSYLENFRSAPEGTVLGIEYQARHANGEWRWMYSQCVVFKRTPEGLPHQILGVSIDITDRKQSEETLQQREAELSLITNAVPVLISYVDADQRYRFNNRGYEEWFGHSAADVCGKHLWEVLGEAAYETIRPYIEQVLAGQQTTFETQVPYKEGGIRDINATYIPRFNDQGTVEGFVALISDISDRKQTQRELQQTLQTLRDSEERLRLTLAAAQQGLYDLNVQTGDAIVSPEYARMLGYDPEEFQETTAKWRDRLHPDDTSVVYQAYEDYISGQCDEYRVEFRQQTKSGDWKWILSVGSIVSWDSHGQPLRMLGTHTDITYRKRAEQDLQVHSERLNLLYETTSELLSAEQPLALMSRLFDKLAAQMDLHYYYYFRVDEREGRQMLRLTHYGGISEEQAKALEWLEFGQSMCGLAAQDRCQVVLNQAEIAAHPNAQLICSIGVSAYAGQPLMVQGRLLGTLSFASLTRTQFMSEEIDLLQAISDQMAIALDRAELMASLQQQTRDLAQANRTKDEFLAVLSHELRSPLNPILGWTKLLQTGKFDSQKTKQALEIIERNVKQQTQLIDDLLDISRILRGKLALNKAPVDLVLVIESAIETVRLAAEAKAIQIEALLAPSVKPVFGDAGRLQQIVWNLLSNAVKFTPPGGRVEVRLAQVERRDGVDRGDGEVRLSSSPSSSSPPSSSSSPSSSFPPSPLSYAQITVTDTGKGITPDFLPYVFESFRQEDSQITRKFGGLGLGLAIVRQITELHGGMVRAESSGEGTGATFTVWLPLLGNREWGTGNRGSNSNASLPMFHSRLVGARILVVDDEADMRDLVATILEQAGAIVQTTASAPEALANYDSFQPMVLVSDIGMPNMDGYQLIRQLRNRSLNSNPQMPAIALTAYAMEYDQQQAIAAGFNRHLAKPIEPQALIQAIDELLHKLSP